MIHAKIANALTVEVENVDLTQARDIEFYLRQGDLFLTYTPTVVDETHMLVRIPFADAMQIRSAQLVSVQFALTDGSGNKLPSSVESVPVLRLLKEAGYD